MSISNLTDADQRKIIHIFQQFVLNRDSSDIRRELYDYMVMYVIYNHSTEQGMEQSKINSYVEQDFHLSNIPPLHIQEAINRLIFGKILTPNGSFLLLSEKKITKFKRTDNEVCELEKEIQNDLKTKLQKILPSDHHDKIDPVVQNIHNLIGNIFLKHGIEAAQMLVNKKNHSFKDLCNFTSFTKMYQNDVLNKIPEEHHEELDKELYDFFSHPSENVCKFLFSMAQSYALAQILNVDPLLRQMQEDSWSKKRIYLDTNIIINLLFVNNKRAEAVKTLIDNTKQLNVNLLITQKTLSEYNGWLENKKGKYKKFKLPYADLATALGEINEEDDLFFDGYYDALKNDPNQNVEKFSKKYEHANILLQNKYSVKVEKTVKEIENTEGIEALKNKISLVAIYPKSNNVSLHDAYSILRVECHSSCH
ncbi:MAG: hypothetical protein ACRDFB_05340 [Rhabdochlamydiaceae bacterium]